jgi:PAS domain S-box-containing protein
MPFVLHSEQGWSEVDAAHKVRLERMTQLYAALSQVNQAIVWSPNRDALLTKICEVMVEFGKFRLAWVGWDDPLTHEVAVVSRYGDTAHYLDSLGVRSDDTPLGRGAVGTAIRTGRTCVINDFLGHVDSTPWHEAAREANLASLASIPFRMDGQVAGAITVYASERDLFGDHELALLEEAAGDVSFALDHLRLEARRQEAEEALKQSRARLQRAESVAHFGNWEFNLGDGFMRASRGARRIYGLDKEMMPLEEAQALVLPECRAILDQALQDLVEGIRPYNVEFRIRRAVDGEVRTIHSVAEYEPDKRTLFGVIHDITDRKEIEDELRESAFFFKESQRAAAIGSYRADFVSGFWTSSAVLDSIFGIGDEFIRDVPGWLSLVHPEDRAMMERHLLEEVMGEHRLFQKQYRIIRPSDGEIRWLHGLGEGGFDAGGVCVSLTGTIQDITDSKLAEQENAVLHAQLMQAQKMESLGILAGGVAHDMNNVLGAILALASAHLTIQPQDSPVYRAFETIQEAATRGGAMVKNLLNFARQKPSETRPLDLNAILQEEARLLERTTLAKVRLVMNLAPDLHAVHGDGSALAHAFMNLCVNAVDAMDEAGTLTLVTRNLGADLVEVRVEDTGLGMSPEVLGKALDPFFTTKGVGKGTGLGLSMVYSTMKAHHGSLDIQSSPGAGTSVSLRFPTGVVQGPALNPLPRAEANPDLRPLTLLLVDDDDLVLSSTQRLMEILGHTVKTATSGEQALELLASGLGSDCVILDMNMPGLGGRGTLPRLREQYPALPVLLATGRTDQEALDLVATHARVTLLAKPFSIEELRGHLASIQDWV